MADDAQAPLKDFEPQHDFFVGVDSDGCAFDSMEIKHKECFAPNIIKHWNLQAVSKYAREAAEFVNLYSQWRGINRFPALLMVFDLLADREEVQRRGVAMPDVPVLRKWADEESKLGEPALLEAIEKSPHPNLEQAYTWSRAVNDAIADMVHGVPPFPGVREALGALSAKGDVICVSATPGEALTREWVEHDISKYAAVIAGQEMGKKAEHICIACAGEIDGKGGVAKLGERYAKDHVLMIGDAPGDMKAARANEALFFPINPGHEEESWDLFNREAMSRFFDGSYAGAYEAKLIEEFHALLPSVPPWKQ